MVNDSSGAGVALILVVVWLLIGLGYLVWYLWAMARLFPRIGLKSSDGWIPIWNQWKLLERAGLPGWVVLLSFVGLGIVPAIMLIIAMYRINTEYGAGAGYTVLGVFVAPLWAMLLANHIGSRSGASFAGVQRGGFSPAAPPVPPPPAAAAGAGVGVGAGLPPLPPGLVTPPVAPAAAPAVPAAQPWAATPGPAAGPPNYSAPTYAAPPAATPTPAQPSPPVPAYSAPTFSAPLGGETEAEYKRLAAEEFLAPPAMPLGQQQAPAPFSWTAASQTEPEPSPAPTPVVPPVHPLAAPAAAPFFAPAPAAHKATGITGKVAPLPADYTPAADAEDDDTDFDRTVVITRKAAPPGVLILSDGTEIPLQNDTVVGRRPEAVDGAVAVAIPDTTRTLSKSHARLTLSNGQWLVEDLDSTNGLVLLHDDGSESEIPAGVQVAATERMLFGTLEVRLHTGGDAP